MTKNTRKILSPRAFATEETQLNQELSLPCSLKSYVVNFCREHMATETQPCLPWGTQGDSLPCVSSCAQVWGKPERPGPEADNRGACPNPAVLGCALYGSQWSLFWRKETWQHESQCLLCPACIWSWINSAHGWDEGGTKEGSWVPEADQPLPWNAGTGRGNGVRTILNLAAAVKILIRHLKTKKYFSLGKLSQS